MQTVTFPCRHCGKMMGVSSAYLGQQVRCPHCQQVVVAPTTAPAPTPPPAPPAPEPPPSLSPTLPPSGPAAAPVPIFLDATISFDRGEQDSIFTPPDPDDLFDSPSAPRLELPLVPPAQPALSPAASEMTIPEQPPVPTLEPTEPDAPSPLPALESTLAFLSPARDEQPATEVLSPSALEPAGFPPPGENGVPGLIPGLAEPLPKPRTACASTGPKLGSNLGFWILILSLISYSVFSTIFVVFLLLRQNITGARHILDEMPDVEGDNPGARKGKKANWTPDEKRLKAPVPANQRVALEKTLQIGDLEITPKKVEQKTLKVYFDGVGQPREVNTLVLTLRLRNLSKEWAFTPLDSFLDRYYDANKAGRPPLTCLEIGTKKFYGGPANWFPRERKPGGLSERREWIEGRKNFEDDLEPGKEIETVVAAGGEVDKVTVALADYTGPLLWRLHLRRGPMRIHGRDVPASTVVGVEFTDQDIQKMN